jgi:polysaccharide deacetylase 2 family uncharacterized protein YibQ
VAPKAAGLESAEQVGDVSASSPATETTPTVGADTESQAGGPNESASGEFVPPKSPASSPTTDSGNSTEGDAPDAEDATAPTQQAALPPAVPSQPGSKATWAQFAAPFDQNDTRPRIAVVLTGLGLSDAATETAIREMPAEVTLSFTPYAKQLEAWIAVARSEGHEVMLDLPMEPTTFPKDDPGPQALITSLSPDENLRRLTWVLDRGSAYVGLAGFMGSRFAGSRDQMRPILKELKARGLVYLDNRPTERSVAASVANQIGLPWAVNNRLIDERQASRIAIDARLAQIERVALTEGYAVAMAQPFPVTLERLATWFRDLDERGFALAPLTALVNRQPIY